uniref:DNA polymerase epsilon catalytic subunit n=1 Tax=Auxenochlorella protothecoides TaxID=3075 RepID=A0A1D2A3C0_AUXPR
MSGTGSGTRPFGAHRGNMKARDASARSTHDRGKRRLNDIGNGSSHAHDAEPAPGIPAEEDQMGFTEYSAGPPRLGWLVNLNTVQTVDKSSNAAISAIMGYFLSQDGTMFRSAFPFSPYFYLHVKAGQEAEVDSWLRRKHEGLILDTELVEREDLDLENHLSGAKRTLLRVSFRTQDQLSKVRRELMPILYRNKSKRGTASVAGEESSRRWNRKGQGAEDALLDMREHDVPHHVRFAIDTDVRCGAWYSVSAQQGRMSLEPRPEMVQRAEARVCAFDIETTKLPLQFPNAEHDQVFMISYMIDRQGYLITNREVVAEDIEDFEYTPKPEFEGPFTIFNCENEAALLKKWFEHMRETKPSIFVTYNGDFFDWPFIETRAHKHGLDMGAEIGFRCNRVSNETLSRSAVHMDCMHWVNRDSYLPQGSRGLKMVTKYKLGYDPVEVDPEDMVRFAAERPQSMASYSVSDAVATYYLYMTYVHPFILSLATIIPMPPDEVLRKGSGTLCEALLMVQAYKANVVAPNKHTSSTENMYGGRLLDSETYIGGKVEALESGVFRSDIPCKFRLSSAAYQGLLDNLDADLKYAIETEGKMDMGDVTNYAEIRAAIATQLEALRDCPIRDETPLIYHLDVAAMYPNIILTNRLQPSAITTDERCAACDFNKPGKTCLRPMEWVWRGETFSATRTEYFSLKTQLQSEMFPPLGPGAPQRSWYELTSEERSKNLKARLKGYCQKVYKRVLNKPTTELRSAGICQRENSFYYDTVESFRDRRYEYKGLNKEWKGRLDKAKASGNPIRIQEAADMCVLYDSLQLAHKCILNSFYGYVMRKGARWYSMEMAGVVTHTGANIIKRANELIGQIGRPLELDTDGIWCALPGSFPETFKFKSQSGKTFKLSYPCAMLNVMVAANNTNDQFAVLHDDRTKEYRTESRMSIEFEVDGPYKAMILPASKEEGKLIKKRYAVFNHDGTLAELKGFELKRRGELKLIKVFQAEIFDQFLRGDSLQGCYDAVAGVANRWLDMLDTQGTDLTDTELVDLISEMCVMSKSLEAYEGRKSCAVTCANRLSQFLGDERIKDKGLVCNYVIARNPSSAPTSGRAIPVAIFSTEPAIARTYLRRWCGDVPDSGPNSVPNVRGIVDWQYYRERLGSAIQKIITIPAAMQLIPNPVPRVAHPDWLLRKVREKTDTHKQRRLDAMLGPATAKPSIGLAGAPHAPVEEEQPRVQGYPVALRAAALSSEEDPASGEEAPSEACPSRHENYAQWLEVKKRLWRQGVEARKKRRTAAEPNHRRGGREGPAQNPEAGAGGLAGMLRQQAASAASLHWQVVGIDHTEQPGVYKCWAVLGGRMHAIPLRIPRTFFANLLAPPSHPLVADMGVLARRALPHGAAAATLVQIVMDEASFRAEQAALNERLLALRALRVYEDTLPPTYNACLQLGCVTAFNAPSEARNLGSGVDLAELGMKTVTECDYLEPGVLRHMALCQTSDAGRGLHLLILHVPVDQRLHIWVINPAPRSQAEITEGAATRVWTEATAAVLERGDHPAGTLPTQPAMDISYARSDAQAYTAINRLLLGLRDRALGPTLLLVSSPEESTLRQSLPSLRDWPTTAVSTPAQAVPFPALGWQLPALRAAASQALACPAWLEARLQAARYAHLPVASMGRDWAIDAADALFARQLRAAGHLLWVSTPDAATAGGSLAARPPDRAEALLLEEQRTRTEVAAPGVYRTVCCEVRLTHLAVNAVLEAAALSELEGTALVDDGKGCGAAFVVLRSLAQAWLDDASRHSNVCADTLLLNMYRWICSPASRLHDPALKQTVQSLMHKLLLHLVSELRRLGVTVVHADATSLILCTGKRNLAAAVGYIDYILETLGKRELLQYLSFTPTRMWHALLYKDRYDYIGIAARVPAVFMDALGQTGSLAEARLLQTHGEKLEVSAEELNAPRFDYHFTLKDFLPSALHATFMTLVTEFLWLPWQAAMQGLEKGPSQGGSQASKDTSQSLEAQTLWLRTALPNQFTSNLLKYVKYISMHVGANDGIEAHAFPERAGSHLSPEELGTPVMAFIKSICAVFSLDASVSDQVLVLRRQLLRMVHVKEFSAEAVFQDPCASLVLRDVICPHCQDCQDLDVCKDPQLQAHDWRCGACGAPRDPVEVESALGDALGTLCDASVLQDLQCLKCHSVATEHLRAQCDHCGGPLATCRPAAETLARVRVFERVARFHGMPVLEELAGWVLAQQGSTA